MKKVSSGSYFIRTLKRVLTYSVPLELRMVASGTSGMKALPTRKK